MCERAMITLVWGHAMMWRHVKMEKHTSAKFKSKTLVQVVHLASMQTIPCKLSLVMASASFLTAHTWKPQRRRASDSTCRTCHTIQTVRKGWVGFGVGGGGRGGRGVVGCRRDRGRGQGWGLYGIVSARRPWNNACLQYMVDAPTQLDFKSQATISRPGCKQQPLKQSRSKS